eukprot:Hpha_TRINITY_DN10198_c0_g1::TRINITY_DN10198_c0_g1_i1::g.131443::m.131443
MLNRSPVRSCRRIAERPSRAELIFWPLMEPLTSITNTTDRGKGRGVPVDTVFMGGEKKWTKWPHWETTTLPESLFVSYSSAKSSPFVPPITASHLASPWSCPSSFLFTTPNSFPDRFLRTSFAVRRVSGSRRLTRSTPCDPRGKGLVALTGRVKRPRRRRRMSTKYTRIVRLPRASTATGTLMRTISLPGVVRLPAWVTWAVLWLFFTASWNSRSASSFSLISATYTAPFLSRDRPATKALLESSKLYPACTKESVGFASSISTRVEAKRALTTTSPSSLWTTREVRVEAPSKANSSIAPLNCLTFSVESKKYRN